MSDNKTDELFEAPKELKEINDEKPVEVKTQEEVPLNAKGKPRKRNKDGTYRKKKEQTPEQREKMLAVLARGREKAREARIKKGIVSAHKKKEARDQLEKEYIQTLEKKNIVQKDGTKDELKELRKELAELKKLFKELGSKPPPAPKETHVEKSVPKTVEPVVESVSVPAVQQSTPVVVKEPPQTLPIPPVVVRKSLRAKSVWSQFV